MQVLRPLVLFLALLGASVAAQDEPIVLETPGRTDPDYLLFRAIYDVEDPVFAATMRGVNIASYPMFFIAVPAVGLADFVSDGEADAGFRLAASELATMGVVFGLKNLIRRTRPYAALPDVERRPVGSHGPPGGIDPFSFPSGHSAVAFSIATSASLSFPEWYVIVPAMTWASATAVARVWHGMHFPSDILMGAIVGSGMALLVHEILAPDDDVLPGDPQNTAQVFSFTLTF